MDSTLFEMLLHEEESTYLDFKKQQYPFSRTTDDQKSELLKDIIGMANAWRRADSYILIGVEDVRGGRSNVIGIPASDQLADHSLQQFINNLTNRPISFLYEAFTFEGKQVGVIRIDEQQARPLYLKRDYGKLKKDEVYVRRGSSTDPTKPASPDEISLMGSAQTPTPPNLGLIKAYFYDLAVKAHELNAKGDTGNMEVWAKDVRTQIENALIGEQYHLFKRDSPADFQGTRQWLMANSQRLMAEHINPNYRIPSS
ncbi:helix-turn-helix domain-containing protein [Fimbriiglobus ruber]|uniref:AlbA family DNA-binding domain-containing protein n=1 Tax=Fimbriiglobus ruber TaxID=1908690 RepID=UPI000B4BD05B|nr:ATP-binding protein [Fimbriiglobus ruber]